MTIALVALLVLAPIQEPSGEGPPDPLPSGPPASRENPLKKLGELLSHPFRDQGRRFDRYPHAGDGPYFLTSRLSTKMHAVMIETSLGRITHDLWSFGTEVMADGSSGSDARIDSLVFEEEVDRGTEETRIHHVLLDIGTFADPSPVDYTLGFGIGALDGEDSNGFGPSLRAAVRGFPARPISFRLDAVLTWFREETIADLRAEVGLHIGRGALTLGVRGLVRSDGDDWIGPGLGMAFYF